MSIVTVEHVFKDYAEPVLRNVSLRLDAGARAGLVGPNGEGKTTLLRIIAGLTEPDDGRVSRRSGLRIGYLPQEPPALPDVTLHEAMLEVFDDLRRRQHELHAIADELADADPDALQRYDRLQAEFELAGGYEYPNRIETVLTGLGFTPEQWRQPLGELSGGQRTRAYLARLLLSEPGLLLLDEPTNHLDLDSVEWLERWLASYDGAAVIVSHDRYLLDRATNRTFDLAFCHLETYRCGYSEYLRQREARYAERMGQWEAQQEYIAATEDYIRRNIYGQRSREAQGRRTRLERFMRTEAIGKPRRHRRISVSLSPKQRAGDWVLRATDLQAGYEPGRPLISAERLEVRRGERVAIVGPNGSGKTTLVRTLLGDLPPLAGRVQRGANVSPGYLSQTQDQLAPGATPLSAVRDATGWKSERARTLLGGFLFSGDEALKPVAELSGGQRSRVVLATLAAAGANLLVLDEPTNHLDIPSQEVLTEVLSAFEGTIVFVSHDRYLIDSLATQMWIIGDGGVGTIPGNWEDYLRYRSEAAGPAARPADQESPEPDGKAHHERRKRERNRVQKMRRRFERVENEVHELEAKLRELDVEISAAGAAGDVQRVERLGNEYAAADERLGELWSEWEELGLALED